MRLAALAIHALLLLAACGGHSHARLDAPRGVTAEAGVKKVVVAWDAARGAASYRVVRLPGGAVVGTTTDTRLVVTGLEPGVPATFAVESVRGARSRRGGSATATPRGPRPALPVSNG